MSHARLLCVSLSPRVCLYSCPLSWWCYVTISSSATPFSFCLQSFPTSGSFPMSQLSASCGQSNGALASATELPMNIQGWFPLGLMWFDLFARDIQDASPAPQFKSINFSALSLLYGPMFTSVHDYWKNHSFDYKVQQGISYIMPIFSSIQIRIHESASL